MKTKAPHTTLGLSLLAVILVFTTHVNAVSVGIITTGNGGATLGTAVPVVTGTTEIDISNIGSSQTTDWYSFGVQQYGYDTFTLTDPTSSDLYNVGISVYGPGYSQIGASLQNTLLANYGNTIIYTTGSQLNPGVVYDLKITALDGGTQLQADSSESLDPPTVPEPSSLALFGSGLFGLAGAVRRKMSK